MQTEQINGILLFYHHRLSPNAVTIMEHANAFSSYSRYKVWNVNVVNGIPRELKKLRFKTIILDNSLFGAYPFRISSSLYHYLKVSSSQKIAFFQEEMYNCRQRFRFINETGIDVIYSLLQPEYFDQVYYANTICKEVRPALTGYVDDQLIENGEKFYKPYLDRSVDIGYRGRRLSWSLGKGGQEKYEIAEKFYTHATGHKFTWDVKTEEKDRLYGDDWYEFIANCRGMLGVEAGSSIFDLNGRVEIEIKDYMSKHSEASFDEVHQKVLTQYEDNLYYRTISPRVFECAALKTCMIHYEGRYNDILIPMEHYIPLKKDFSNFEQVMEIFKNPAERSRITENAYRDLIASGRYSYREFIRTFDEKLNVEGLTPVVDRATVEYVNRIIETRSFVKAGWAKFDGFARNAFRKYIPAQERIKRVVQPVIRKLKSLRWENFS